jgi:hypothetical protein
LKVKAEIVIILSLLLLIIILEKMQIFTLLSLWGLFSLLNIPYYFIIEKVNKNWATIIYIALFSMFINGGFFISLIITILLNIYFLFIVLSKGYYKTKIEKSVLFVIAVSIALIITMPFLITKELKEALYLYKVVSHEYLIKEYSTNLSQINEEQKDITTENINLKGYYFTKIVLENDNTLLEFQFMNNKWSLINITLDKEIVNNDDLNDIGNQEIQKEENLIISDIEESFNDGRFIIKNLKNESIDNKYWLNIQMVFILIYSKWNSLNKN